MTTRHYDDGNPPTMFINPLLALLFEAGLLQRDIEQFVPPAHQQDMQDRLTRIAKLAECIKSPIKALPVSRVIPGPVDREYPFPVIRGGKE